MENNLNITPDIIEAIKFVVAVVAPFLAGWFGLKYGLIQIKEERRLTFVEKQLSEFYSPLLGLHKEIRAKSELRVKIEEAGGKLWNEGVAAGLPPSIEPTEKEIAYNNKQLRDEFLPMYREMLAIFRKGYWLAEPETRNFYADLVEYVEGWTRWEAGGVPPAVMQKIGHTEEKLRPFYNELTERTDVLRKELAQKN